MQRRYIRNIYGRASIDGAEGEQMTYTSFCLGLLQGFGTMCGIFIMLDITFCVGNWTAHKQKEWQRKDR